MKKKSAFNLKNVPPIKQGLAIVLIILIDDFVLSGLLFAVLVLAMASFSS